MYSLKKAIWNQKWSLAKEAFKLLKRAKRIRLPRVFKPLLR